MLSALGHLHLLHEVASKVAAVLFNQSASQVQSANKAMIICLVFNQIRFKAIRYAFRIANTQRKVSHYPAEIGRCTALDQASIRWSPLSQKCSKQTS